SGARPPKTAAAVCRAAKPRASRSAPGCRCHAVSVRGREEGCWWEHHRQIRPDGARTGCQGAEGAGQLAQRRESLRGDEAGGADEAEGAAGADRAAAGAAHAGAAPEEPARCRGEAEDHLPPERAGKKDGRVQGSARQRAVPEQARGP
ncbi:unnamed protein product, partial [Prorocentrum cordatum]